MTDATINILSNKGYFVQGDIVFEETKKILIDKYQFKECKEQAEIKFNGETIYNAEDKKPSIFPNKLWKSIIDHNDNVYDDDDSSEDDDDSSEDDDDDNRKDN